MKQIKKVIKLKEGDNVDQKVLEELSPEINKHIKKELKKTWGKNPKTLKIKF